MTEPAPDDPPESSARERRPVVPVRARIRDKVLWILLVLMGLAVVAYFVARDYHLHQGGVDCFPYCTFKQDLSNYGQATFYIAILLALAAVVRWVRLGRRSAAEN